MNDTPEHIKDLQLKLWLAKSPGERLYQFLIDNDDFYREMLSVKKYADGNIHLDKEWFQQSKHLR